MAALLARAAIGDGLVAEIYEDGVLWISKTTGEHQEMKLTDDSPANLLTFLEKNRDLLQVLGQDEQERTDTLADITMSHNDKDIDA